MLDSSDLALIRRLTQLQISESVRNLTRGTGGASIPLPITRLGTVGASGDVGTEISVRGDGDVDAVPAINATGVAVEAGDRVLVDWLPGGRVYVAQLLSRASRGNWTPSIGGGTSANGAGTRVGHYTRRGHQVTIYGIWEFGAGSALDATSITLGGLPFPVISDGDGIPAVLGGYVYDASVPRRFPLMIEVPEGQTSDTPYTAIVAAAPGAVLYAEVDATQPMTWAIGDRLVIFGTYDTDAA